MSVFSKIITAIRGGAREMGEAIVDANGVRIFEQEIKDAEHHLEEAKRDLTAVVAKEMQAARKVEQLTKEVKKHEGYAAKALEQGNEDLALEVAEKIAGMQGEIDVNKKAQQRFKAHVERLKEIIKKTTASLADMKRQLVMVKTTESVHKATKSITENYATSGSKLLTAKESLDRIQQRQQDLDDRLEAGQDLQDEFEGRTLDQKLKEAGIGETSTTAQDILAKLKDKKDA